VAERDSTISVTEYSVREMVILINSFTYVHMENLKLDRVKELRYMFPFYVHVGAGVAVGVCNPWLQLYHLSAISDPK
jgi:hypothetical protein